MALPDYEYRRTSTEAHEQASRARDRRAISELAYCSPPRPAIDYINRRNRPRPVVKLPSDDEPHN
jgi:hypothetical protein